MKGVISDGHDNIAAKAGERAKRLGVGLVVHTGGCPLTAKILSLGGGG
ncbi:MAG: hypothetical protein ACK4M3_02750 [Pyrobaculum sp.]